MTVRPIRYAPKDVLCVELMLKGRGGCEEGAHKPHVCCYTMFVSDWPGASARFHAPLLPVVSVGYFASLSIWSVRNSRSASAVAS